MGYDKAKWIANKLYSYSCLGKRSWASTYQARQAAQETNNDRTEPLIAYQCPFCLLYHVGHRKSRKWIQMEKLLHRHGYTLGDVRVLAAQLRHEHTLTFSYGGCHRHQDEVMGCAEWILEIAICRGWLQ